VAWMFKKKGSILLGREDNAISEEELMLLVLDAGAEDLRTEPDSFEVITAPGDFPAVLEAVRKANLSVAEAEVAMVPQNTIELSGGQAQKCLGLIEALEEHEDVQNVYTNYDIAGE